MASLDLHMIWPIGLDPTVNVTGSLVGFVSLLFFYEAFTAKKLVSCRPCICFKSPLSAFADSKF